MQLNAAGTAGIGSAATPLLYQPVDTDNEGHFYIPASYACPSASSQLYVVARGGHPGLSSGADNPAIALTTMLGDCGSLSAAASVTVNEVTTYLPPHPPQAIVFIYWPGAARIRWRSSARRIAFNRCVSRDESRCGSGIRSR